MGESGNDAVCTDLHDDITNIAAHNDRHKVITQKKWNSCKSIDDHKLITNQVGEIWEMY